MRVQDYIRKLVTDAFHSVALGKDDILIECEIEITHRGKDFVVTAKDEHGNDVTEIIEAVLSKGDTATLKGMYTTIKFQTF